MTDGGNLPPARERNRYGLRAFTSDRPPQPDEALLDRVVMRVGGHVRGRDPNAIRNFTALISSSPTAYSVAAPRLFGVGSWQGSRWRARCVAGTTISGGELKIYQRGAEARLDLELWINPIRTLEHLMQRYDLSDLDRVTAAEFFQSVPETPAHERTLDGRDNMVSDYLTFSGSFQSGAVQRVATYLHAFERALQGRVLEELCPVQQGFYWHDDAGDIVAESDDLHLRLNWSALNVSQCEVCWERKAPDALPILQRLAQGVLAAARRVEVPTYRELVGATVGRDSGAVSIKLPLVPASNVMLVLYAKEYDRLRIEVRYFPDLSQEVRRNLPTGARRLVDWFDAFRQDAAPRVPWTALHHLLQPPMIASRTALIEIVEAVAAATDRFTSKRRDLLSELLETGGLTATGRSGRAPVAIVRRLAERGIVEHVRFVARDPEVGRRYRLTPKYANVPQFLAERETGDQ